MFGAAEMPSCDTGHCELRAATAHLASLMSRYQREIQQGIAHPMGSLPYPLPAPIAPAGAGEGAADLLSKLILATGI